MPDFIINFISKTYTYVIYNFLNNILTVRCEQTFTEQSAFGFDNDKTILKYFTIIPIFNLIKNS